MLTLHRVDLHIPGGKERCLSTEAGSIFLQIDSGLNMPG